MKSDFDKHRDVWGPLFALQMRLWAERVFAPASVLIENGQLPLKQWGTYPYHAKTGSGAYFSNQGIQLKLLTELPAGYERVKYFDYAAAEYELATHEFKKHIVDKAFREMLPCLDPRFRILECGCGPGYEAIALSMKVKKGEVVAVDLSTEMITLACKNAKFHRVRNMCFYQYDVQQLPPAFLDQFDAVYCQLNCSYFEDMHAVAKSLYSVLQHQGFVFLVEPYPNMPNSRSIPSARAANPYFERMYAKEELEAFFTGAGFSGFFWKEIMPGIGISIITKN